MKETEEFLRTYSGDRLAIDPKEGEMLYLTVFKNFPETVVEVGTGKGYSTTWLLLGLEKVRHGRLITIDREIPIYPVWGKTLISLGRLSVKQGTLEEHVNSLPGNVGLVFLDSDHQINNIVKDMELLAPKIEPGGIVFVHDVNYIPNMGRLLKDYCERKDSDELRHCGVTIPEERLWEDYREITGRFGLGMVRRVR